MWLLKDLGHFNNFIKEIIVFLLLVILMLSFIYTGFIVIENNLNYIFGGYTNKEIIRTNTDNADLQTDTNKEHISKDIKKITQGTTLETENSTSIHTTKTVTQYNGIYRLSIYLEKIVTLKSKKIIVLLTDKISYGIDNLASILVKILQTT